MKFLLKLKHWQLFGLTWGFAIIISILGIPWPGILISLYPVMMIFFVFGTFGWIWAISTNLNAKLPQDTSLNKTVFQGLFLIPTFYIVAFVWIISGAMNEPGTGTGIENNFGLILTLHFLSMIIIIWGMRFAAKTLKSIELGRTAHFADYVVEFFLIWFSVIGYWILQPRLNKLVEE